MSRGYAIATVVGRTAPVSSHLGDRAIVRTDGRMDGFIGGSCSRDIIRRQALAAMRSGEPRLVRIRPDAQFAHEDREVVTIPMGCASEGAVDVFIQPHLPRRRLLVAGFTPVANALAGIAPALGYAVARFLDEAELRELKSHGASNAFPIESLGAYVDALDAGVRERSAALAATQGHYDEIALGAVLRHDLAYVGLLASRKRAAAVMDVLKSEGIPAERLAQVRSPAGLSIGARKPADVALSIFAEIVATAAAQAPAREEDVRAESATARDPVCGMDVELADARYRSDFQERTYYFCCPHCRAAFDRDPLQYLAAAASP